MKEECKHRWLFDYQEYYDGQRPGYIRDVFHCEKCLKREYVTASQCRRK